MKKISLVLLVLILILAGASPYVAGRIIEKNYYKFIGALNAKSHGHVKFVGEFMRGYFNSSAYTTITISANANNIKLAHIIQHGPVIFNLNTYMPQGYGLGLINTSFINEAETYIKNIYGNNHAYDIITKISTRGDLATIIKSYPIKAEFSIISDITWQGADASIQTDVNFSTAKYNIIIPLITYTEVLDQANSQSVSVTNIKFDSQFSGNTNKLFDLKVEDVKVFSNTEAILMVDNIYLRLLDKTEVNTRSQDYSFGFKTLKIGKPVYGPLTLNIKAHNLTDKLFDELINTIVVNTSEPQKMFIAEMSLILANKISFDVDLQLTTETGKINFSTHANQTIKQHLEISKALLYLIFEKYAERQIYERRLKYFTDNETSNVLNPYQTTPEALKIIVTNWIQLIMTKLKDEKLIIENGDNITFDLTYVNNEITINSIPKTSADLDKLKPMLEVMPVPQAPAPVIPQPPAPSVQPVPIPVVPPGQVTIPSVQTIPKP